MKTVLVLFFLSVQSSYAKNVEERATEETFDTIQFYGCPEGCQRVKTYATDQDVHVWSIGSDIAGLTDLARANTEKNYGDVLSEGYVIETASGLEGLRRALTEKGLSSTLEVTDFGAVFWAPEGSSYRTKTRPAA